MTLIPYVSARQHRPRFRSNQQDWVCLSTATGIAIHAVIAAYLWRHPIGGANDGDGCWVLLVRDLAQPAGDTKVRQLHQALHMSEQVYKVRVSNR